MTGNGGKHKPPDSPSASMSAKSPSSSAKSSSSSGRTISASGCSTSSPAAPSTSSRRPCPAPDSNGLQSNCKPHISPQSVTKQASALTFPYHSGQHNWAQRDGLTTTTPNRGIPCRCGRKPEMGPDGKSSNEKRLAALGSEGGARRIAVGGPGLFDCWIFHKHATTRKLNRNRYGNNAPSTGK